MDRYNLDISLESILHLIFFISPVLLPIFLPDMKHKRIGSVG